MPRAVNHTPMVGAPATMSSSSITRLSLSVHSNESIVNEPRRTSYPHAILQEHTRDGIDVDSHAHGRTSCSPSLPARATE